MTPEGRIKAKIDKVLNNTAAGCWYFKPVQYGYGMRALDYICCINGQFVAIEVKRPGGEPTDFQRLTCIDMYHAGGKVWIISSEEGVLAFAKWLQKQSLAEVRGASW